MSSFVANTAAKNTMLVFAELQNEQSRVGEN